MARPRLETAIVKLNFRSTVPRSTQEPSLDFKLITHLNQLSSKMGHEWVEETLKGIIRDAFANQKISFAEHKVHIDEIVEDRPLTLSRPQLASPSFNDDD